MTEAVTSSATDAVTRALRPEIAAKFLEPRSVALVGVSTSGGEAYRVGGRAVLDHLRVYGYAGQVTVVHPNATEVDGCRAVPSLLDIGQVPDVVVIAVPARHVRGTLEQCAAVGARQVLVLTAGFGDMGQEGLALEESLLAYARENGINVVGPNSTGLVTVGSGLAMSMTSVLTEGRPIQPGGLAVIAQSGAIGSTVVERGRLAGVGFSHIVSTGNQRDMDVPDFVSYFARHPDVHTVALYVESIRDGDLFARAVRELQAGGRRMVAYLGGRTDAGELAAASHTGKIVGRGALEEALLRSLGVIVVDDPDDLWVIGATSGYGAGAAFPRKWGMVAYSGGMAVLATEQLAAAGIEFPALSDATFRRVKEKSPDFAAARNPLDVGPGSMPGDFRFYLSAVAADPSVEAVCWPIPMGARGWSQRCVDDVLAVRQESGKPFVILWYGGDAIRPYTEQLRRRGVLVADKPSDLGRQVRALVGPERELRSSRSSPADRPGATVGGVPSATGGATALRRLERASIDVARMRHCADDTDEVRRAAAEIGYPVALKTGDPSITHRTELGLVTAGIDSDAALTAALEVMRERAMAAGVGEHPSWLVQAMTDGQLELVITVRDAGQLGVFGSVGIGGVAVEVLRDVQSVPLPCQEDALRRALSRLRTADLLFGFRGSPPVDIGWIHAALHGLGDVLRGDGLAEIEVNPALVGANGGVVVDALLVR